MLVLDTPRAVPQAGEGQRGASTIAENHIINASSTIRAALIEQVSGGSKNLSWFTASRC
jgi:hypothetical protein